MREEITRKTERIRRGIIGFATIGILLAVQVCPAQRTEPLLPQDAALIALARATVRSAVTGKPSSAAPPTEIATLPGQGVFVTIEREGNVIGCRGTLRPRDASLMGEVITAARSAATTDPRYPPLTPADLAHFLVTVTLVERLDPISPSSIYTLSPDNGLALEANGKIGVVLPWEGRDPRTRLQWAYRKAGVAPNSSCRLWRLVARRFRG